MKNEIRESIKRYAKPAVLFLTLILGVVLITVPFDKNEKETGEDGVGYTKLAYYTTDAEKRLEEIISGIDGAGQTKVMITFESSFESVYANNAKIEENGAESVSALAKTSEKEIVLAGDRSGAETPVLLKELCPRVKGVLVVCEGGDIESVSRGIKQAVAALFGISDGKIFVSAGNYNR